MKIKNQFRISIITFSIVLTIIAVSVLIAQEQAAQLNGQVDLAEDIQTGANNLSYLSNNYFLYQEDTQLALWQQQFSSLSTDLTKLIPSTPEQQTLQNNVKDDAQRLSAVFAGVVSFLENAPRNVSVRVLPAFQTEWGRMAVQNQALAFDAQQLSQTLRTQVDQLNFTNLILIFAFLGLFGSYFITNYLITYRSTLKSISDLQAGIAVIGSGNLDYSLKGDKKDEIGEISQSFNQMTANLKTVIASKTELEKEISERKIAEERLQSSETLLNSFFDSPGIMRGIVEVVDDADIRHIKDNEVTARYIGLTSVDLQGKLSSELGEPPERIQFWIKHYKQSQLNGQPVGFEYTDRQDSKESWLAATVTYLDTSSSGHPRFAYVVADDTARKKTEALMRKSEVLEATAFYTRNLIEASLDPLVTINAEGKITDANKATEVATGCSREQLIGSDFSEYFTEPEKAKTGYTRVFTEGFVRDYPLTIRHKSGKITYVLYNAAVYRNEAGEIQGVFAAARDITERKEAEKLAQESAKKLKDAERLAAIGATAGMVGHDIRNPLQSIVGDLYLAKSDLKNLPESEEKEGMAESIQAIEDSVMYVNKIVADLQDFARPLNPRAEETNLKAVIDELLTKNGLPQNIEATTKIAKDATTITADPAYVKRIVGNLISNAIQAMPNGGKLTINATGRNGNAVMTVTDTGVGIPEDVKPKLFTPLFTTKSKGQGFGLAVVKRMAEALGGTVTFTSEQGKGTTFTITIPQNP